MDNKRWVLGLASVASFMVALDAMVVTMALSKIKVDLEASLEQLEWTANAYSLTFAVLLMPAAAVGDRFGRRRMFVSGVAVFLLASVACATAPSIGLLIAARALQGAGAALVMPLAIALLSTAYPPQERAGALGVFSGITGVAVLAGPMVGGAVTEGLAWQWIFWINVPIALVLIPLVLSKVGESRGPVRPIDYAGVALVAVGGLGLVWGLVRGEFLVSLVVGVPLLALYVVRERELFRIRAFSSGVLATLSLYGTIYGSLFFVGQFGGPLEAAVRMIPWTVPMFVVAPLAGRLVSRIGERPLVAGGLALQAVGMGWMALTVTPTANVVAPLLLAGVGASMAMPGTQNSVLSSVEPAFIGKASGIFSTVRQFAGAFGVAVLAVVFTSFGGYGSAEAFSAGLGPVCGVAAALSLVGAVAGLGTGVRELQKA